MPDLEALKAARDEQAIAATKAHDRAALEAQRVAELDEAIAEAELKARQQAERDADLVAAEAERIGEPVPDFDDEELPEPDPATLPGHDPEPVPDFDDEELPEPDPATLPEE